jgi:hypothetical protein
LDGNRSIWIKTAFCLFIEGKKQAATLKSRDDVPFTQSRFFGRAISQDIRYQRSESIVLCTLVRVEPDTDTHLRAFRRYTRAVAVTVTVDRAMAFLADQFLLCVQFCASHSQSQDDNPQKTQSG